MKELSTTDSCRKGEQAMKNKKIFKHELTNGKVFHSSYCDKKLFWLSTSELKLFVQRNCPQIAEIMKAENLQIGTKKICKANKHGEKRFFLLISIW